MAIENVRFSKFIEWCFQISLRIIQLFSNVLHSGSKLSRMHLLTYLGHSVILHYRTVLSERSKQLLKANIQLDFYNIFQKRCDSSKHLMNKEKL